MISSGITLNVPGNITTTAGSAGYLTINGSNGMSYDDIRPKSIVVQGQAQFDSDVEVKGSITVRGVNLAESLARIEERLNLLQPNLKLEAEWEQLRVLGEQYRQLERDMLDKLELVGILGKKY
jgi:hypothetical protein